MFPTKKRQPTAAAFLWEIISQILYVIYSC